MSDTLDFTRQDTILVVDDAPDNLTLMTGILRGEYKTKVANGGQRGLEVASATPRPDLVLLDIDMPGMDGYEVCRRLKADAATADIPVIFLTAKTGVDDEQRGFDAGCVDYITKPVSPPIVLARVKAQLMLKGAKDYLRDQAAFLEAEVGRRMRETERAQRARLRDVIVLAQKLEDAIARVRGRPEADPELVRALAGVGRELKTIAAELTQNAGDT